MPETSAETIQRELSVSKPARVRGAAANKRLEEQVAHLTAQVGDLSARMKALMTEVLSEMTSLKRENRHVETADISTMTDEDQFRKGGFGNRGSMQGHSRALGYGGHMQGSGNADTNHSAGYGGGGYGRGAYGGGGYGGGGYGGGH